MPLSRAFTSSVIAALLLCGAVSAGNLVPFVIPAKPNPNSPIAAPPSKPINTYSDRLTAGYSHFRRADDRICLWGVNLSFGANMPTHEERSSPQT